ncbi:MAG: hypothetical protein R3C42_09950 [Parvularculaceae bacterium]
MKKSKLQITKQILISGIPVSKTSYGDAFSAQVLRDCEELALKAIVENNFQITGEEVELLRKHLNFKVRQFAALFKVSHPAVLKWEKSREPLDSYTQLAIKYFISDRFKVRLPKFDKILSPEKGSTKLPFIEAKAA